MKWIMGHIVIYVQYVYIVTYSSSLINIVSRSLTMHEVGKNEPARLSASTAGLHHSSKPSTIDKEHVSGRRTTLAVIKHNIHPFLASLITYLLLSNRYLVHERCIACLQQVTPLSEAALVNHGSARPDFPRLFKYTGRNRTTVSDYHDCDGRPSKWRVSAFRPILAPGTGRPGSASVAVSGLQAVSRKAATPVEDMGIRRFKASVWVGDVAFGKSDFVNVLRWSF